MKKMKKSALAAAVLLSLSMMGSVYAEDYSNGIAVSAGQQIVIEETGDITIQPEANVNCITFVEDAGGASAKSSLIMTTDGNMDLVSKGVPVVKVVGTTNPDYGVELTLKGNNITLTKDGFQPFYMEASGNGTASVTIDAKDTLEITTATTGYGIGVFGGLLNIDAKYVKRVTGSGIGIWSGGEVNIGQNAVTEDIIIKGGYGIANEGGTIYMDAKNIDIGRIYTHASYSNEVINIGNRGFGEVLNIATSSNIYAVSVTGTNSLISLKSEKMDLLGYDGGTYACVNVAASDNLFISGQTVNVKASPLSVECDGVAQNAGNITLDGNGGTMTWNSGKITGAGTTNVSGNVTMNVGAVANTIKIADGADLTLNMDIDSVNGKADTVTVGNIETEGTGTLNTASKSMISFDIDLSKFSGETLNTGDKLTDNNTGAHTIALKRVGLLGEAAVADWSKNTTKTYQVTDNTKTTFSGSVKSATSDGLYTFTGQAEGIVSVKRENTVITLANAISGSSYITVTDFYMNDDVVTNAKLGSLADNGGSRELTIHGNGYKIDGNGQTGVTVQKNKNQVLNLVNVASMTGFNGNAITNNAGGTVNVEGDTHIDKVSNTGTLNTKGNVSIDTLTVGSGSKVNATGLFVSDKVSAIGKNNTMGAEHTYAFGENNEVTGTQSIAAGFGNKVSGSNSGAFGDPNEVSGNGSYAVGNNNTVSGNNSFALGNGTNVSGNGSVALGDGSVADKDNVVSVGSETQQRKIVNVADGTVAEGSTDAVNGGQLWAVDKKIDGIIGGDITELENKVDSNVSALNNRIDQMGTRINKVGAGAAALAAMHPVYDEDSKLTFSAGLGAYRNEKAAAVGMFFRFSPRVMMNAGATVGNDNNMYNVGLNFALDKHVRGGLPSKAVMAKQLTAQSAEIADLKTQMAQQKADHDAQIAKLLALIEELKNR